MVLEKTPESPLDCKETQPVHPKGGQFSLEGLMLKLKIHYFGHLIQRANSLEKSLMLGKIEGRRRSRHQRMRWAGWQNQWDRDELGLTLGDGEGQGGLMCCSLWGCKESNRNG